MSKFVKFFRVPSINIPANIEIKILSILKGIKGLAYRRLLEIGIVGSK